MLFINNAVPVIGVSIMFYVMLTQRISTKRIELGIFFALSMGLWVFLFWADWTEQFNPVWQTVAGRVIILLMTLCVVKKAWRDTPCKTDVFRKKPKQRYRFIYKYRPYRKGFFTRGEK